MKSYVKKKKCSWKIFVILLWHFLGWIEIKWEIIFAYPTNWSWRLNTYAKLVNRQQSSGRPWTVRLFVLILKEVTNCGIILCPIRFLVSSTASCLLKASRRKVHSSSSATPNTTSPWLVLALWEHYRSRRTEKNRFLERRSDIPLAVIYRTLWSGL